MDDNCEHSSHQGSFGEPLLYSIGNQGQQKKEKYQLTFSCGIGMVSSLGVEKTAIVCHT